jgi:hypothetical protein
MHQQSSLYSRLESRITNESQFINEATAFSDKGSLANECLAGFLFADKVLSQIANDATSASKADSALTFYHDLSAVVGPLNSKSLPKSIFGLDTKRKESIILAAVNEGLISEPDSEIALSSGDNKAIDHLTLSICKEVKGVLPLAIEQLSSEIKSFKVVEQKEMQAPLFGLS